MTNPLRWPMAGFRWTRTALAMLREARTHRVHMESARDLLARELRQNANYAGQWEDQNWSIQNVQAAVTSARWHQYGAEWSVLRRKHRELWEEVADAYDGLERTRNHGAQPPSRATLIDLAARLEEAQP
jgi:hypothetical protein